MRSHGCGISDLAMLLRGVRLKNYRAFVREVNLVLRPLTLLFGYNSAGKSALLRALPLIAESILDGPLALGGRAVRGSKTFREVRTRWSHGESMSLGLDWSAPGESLDVELLHLASRERQIIDTFELRRAGEPNPLRFTIDIPDERAVDLSTYTLDGAPGKIHFEGWRPKRVEGFDGNGVSTRMREEESRLEALAGSVHWLGAVRAQPERHVQLVGSNGIRDDGGGTIEALARASLEPGSDVVPAISRWFEGATEHALTVRPGALGGAPVYHIELRPLRAPLGIHLSDTGEGMTQVLPVITLGALAIKGRLGEHPILAIEQPELHLHPRAHIDVANHLVDVAKHATTVVETHSENFLLAAQLAVATGRIRSEDVIVHWVKSTAEGPSFVETITFDDKARPSAWPPGVFSEDHDLARRLIALRLGTSSS